MVWEVLLGASSTVVAVAALVFSVVSFNRQQARAELHASISVRPLLSIRSQNLSELKTIKLCNFGVGPAIVRRAEFRRLPGDSPTDKLADLFDIGCGMELLTNVPESRAIPADGEILLVKLSMDYLLKKGFSRDESVVLLGKWKAQKKGILVRIEYSDLYGNEMPPVEDTLI